MKIAIDGRSVHPGRGGIGNYTMALMKAIAEIDDENEYLIFRSGKDTEQPIVEKRNFREIPCGGGMINELMEQTVLPDLLYKFQVDLFHSTLFFTPAIEICPTVATIHDVVFHFRPDLVDEKLCSYLEKWSAFSAHYAERVVTDSEFSKKTIIDAYGTNPKKVSVVPLGVDERFRKIEDQAVLSPVKARYQLPDCFALYVGSIEEKKNVGGLLDAVALLRKKSPDDAVPLVIAGGGGGQAYDVRSEIARRDLGEHVRVLGYVPDDDLPCLYNLARVFVYLSFYEGFGLPPLEAMACGVPTVVSNATSLPEVVGDGAQVVDPNDVESIADAIRKVASDEDLRVELSENGRQRARQFKWSETAKRMLEIYNEVNIEREEGAAPVGGDRSAVVA